MKESIIHSLSDVWGVLILYPNPGSVILNSVILPVESNNGNAAARNPSPGIITTGSSVYGSPGSSIGISIIPPPGSVMIFPESTVGFLGGSVLESTLEDESSLASNSSELNPEVSERIMDSNDLEKERGITISTAHVEYETCVHRGALLRGRAPLSPETTRMP